MWALAAKNRQKAAPKQARPKRAFCFPGLSRPHAPRPFLLPEIRAIGTTGRILALARLFPGYASPASDA